jgi:hypothetical protein
MSAPKYAGEILYAGESPVIKLMFSSNNADLYRQFRHRNALRLRLRQCLKKFPTGAAEGIIDFDGVEHFITYSVEDDYVSAVKEPRDVAEAALNAEGLSTYELFD